VAWIFSTFLTLIFIGLPPSPSIAAANSGSTQR
jgi:hypothetical protein